MTNALLVRYGRGWHEVIDADAITAEGRREGTLALGATESTAEVERVAASQLNRAPREAIGVDLVPTEAADTPYVGFNVGDVIEVPDSAGAPTDERVVSITVAEDDNGILSYAPELKGTLLTQDERLEQAIARIGTGAMQGTSAVATPVPNSAVSMPIVTAAATATATQWAISASSGSWVAVIDVAPSASGLLTTPYYWFATDPDTAFDENGYVIVPYDGAYSVAAYVYGSVVPTGVRWMIYRMDNTDTLYREVLAITPDQWVARGASPMLAGDRIVIQAFNDSADTAYGLQAMALDIAFQAPFGVEDIPPAAS